MNNLSELSKLQKLLEKKLSKIEEIKKITEEILKNSISEEPEICDSLLAQRKVMMNEVDKINEEIETEKKEKKAEAAKIVEDAQLKIFSEKIDKTLEETMELDEKIRQNMYSTMKTISEKIKEAEEKIEKSDYDVNEIQKKPAGYFLNRKG